MTQLRLTGFAARLPELAAVALSAVIALTLMLGIQYQRQVASVERTLTVETQLAEFMVALDNVELGQRGYILTGEAASLWPWHVGARLIGRRLKTIGRLTADNPEQARTIALLQPLVGERVAGARETIDLRRVGDFTGALAKVRGSRERDLSQDIRALVTTMKHEEKRVFAARTAAARATTEMLSRAALVGILVMTAALSYWIWKARRDARELAAANQRLIDSMAEREAVETQLRHMRKMEAIGQLTGGIAHDSNNILAVITSALNLMERRLAEGDTNIGKFVEAATDAADRGARLIRRLLAFARQQPLSPEPVNPNRLVGGMSELMARTLGEDIEISTFLAEDAWWTHADPSQLENALLNIGVNARDAMLGGGKLTISTANRHLDARHARTNPGVSPGDYVLIAISDTGSGMTPEVCSRAFEPFFTTKDVGKGSGLGLSQVFGFVKQSKGNIELRSEVGKGTTVNIYLPRFDTQAMPRIAVGHPVPRAPALSNSHELVLVVEDEARVRALTVAALSELGYTVIQANGGAEALRRLDCHPDTALLFTDIVMPEINGRTLAELAVRRHPRLKVLFTTGFARESVMHTGTLETFGDLLPKPFSLDDLATKVREVLRH